MINVDGTGLEQITFDNAFDSFPMFLTGRQAHSVFLATETNGRTRNTNVFSRRLDRLATWYTRLNKPFGVLSQFSDEGAHPGILSLDLDLPKDIWPIGRLDRDSEGLLLLTNDMRLRQQLTDPKENSSKTYWVQIEGVPAEESLARLQQPMVLRIKKQDLRTKTRACATHGGAGSLGPYPPPHSSPTFCAHFLD